MNTYERIEHFNTSKKAQISESMNYSILSGMILTSRKNYWLTDWVKNWSKNNEIATKKMIIKLQGKNLLLDFW